MKNYLVPMLVTLMVFVMVILSALALMGLTAKDKEIHSLTVELHNAENKAEEEFYRGVYVICVAQTKVPQFCLLAVTEAEEMDLRSRGKDPMWQWPLPKPKPKPSY